MKYFENLARVNYDYKANLAVKEELIKAGVPVISLSHRPDAEVQTYYVGILNGFVFERMWKYWSVKGYFPLSVAQKMYEEHENLCIRVSGHAGNPNPNDWAIRIPDKKTELDDYFIQLYHIDTEEGLKVFVDMIKEYNIQTDFI